MIAVIGGGPAGRFAAMRLARADKEVCLVERNKIGGQCLHYGCMVVCALNDIARLTRNARALHRLEILEEIREIRFSRLMQALASVQEKIQRVLEEETRQTGVEILYSTEGRVIGRNLLLNGEPVDTEGVIVATGSHPNIPDIQGLSREVAITPHTLSGMQEIPERLAILGGGVMAAEFAYIFNTFGSEVTILARSSFLRDANAFIQKMARRELEGVSILERVQTSGIERTGGGVAIQCAQDGRDIHMEFDTVLLASGLSPTSECAEGLEKGVHGEIIVDNRMRTSVEGVYAAGDVTGPPYLTPVARMEGVVAAENMLGMEREMDYRFVPRSISLANDLAYCETESGSGRVMNLTAPCPAGSGSFWHVPEGYTGASRITLDPSTRKILGFSLAAPGGSLIANYLTEFLRLGLRVEDLDGMLEVHPNTDGIIPLVRYASDYFKKSAGR